MKPVIIVPTLNPDEKLIDLVRKLKKRNLPIVIINDGSKKKCTDIFETLKLKFGCDIFTHTKNIGKGAAIKSGIKYVSQRYPESCGYVTADADGQHSAEDILKVAEALEKNSHSLILGSRNFGEKNVPFKSRWGNRITSFVFLISTSNKCPDTQTGLRGIPKEFTQICLCIPGERFEYEMNMLLEFARRKISTVHVPIATIYLEDNKSSHFNVVRDSVLIYLNILKYSISSLGSAIIDLIAFTILINLIFGKASAGILAATVVARFMSGSVNFMVNKHWVFKSGNGNCVEMIKYLTLFFSQMMLSFILVTSLSNLSLNLTIIKILVDSTLFLISYQIQKRYIFNKKERVKKVMKKFLSKPYRWAAIFSILLVGAFSFTLLDTFVLQKSITNVKSITSYASTTSTAAKSTAVITDKSYQDENIKINIETVRKYNSTIYVADIQVSDASYLKTALASNTYGRNITATTSDIAETKNAIFAINGDFYGFRDGGYVLRNGIVYRSSVRSTENNEALVVDKSGNLSVISESTVSMQSLSDNGALQVLSFGPGLVENGKIAVTSSSEVGQSMTSNPRTAIGQISDLHYVVIVSDGRTSASEGLSLLELAQEFKERSCTVAYNLDGGGSSTMYFNGKIINNPTDGGSGGERKVSDIVYFGY